MTAETRRNGLRKAAQMHNLFQARPVSGEIMTDAAAAAPKPSMARRGAPQAAVEAEFETVGPPNGAGCFRKDPVGIPAGIDFLKGSVGEDRLASGRGGLAFWTMGAILVTAAFLLSGGAALIGEVRSGLSIGDKQAGGFHTTSVSPPHIRTDGQSGGAERHFLGTSAGQANAQGSFVFAADLGAPKDGEKSVSVSYGED